jgi:short-subunit dehydrogenase
MRARRRGRIVNIASFGGKVPAPHLAAYAASKFALVGLSESLRAELLDDGIFVTTACPGLMRTGSARQAFFKGQQEKELQFFATAAHLPVVSISPERIARRIVDATQFGEAEVIVPFIERWLTKMHALMPGLSTDAAALVNALLPGRAPTGGDYVESGKAIENPGLGPFTRSRMEQAERRFNQRSE